MSINNICDDILLNILSYLEINDLLFIRSLNNKYYSYLHNITFWENYYKIKNSKIDYSKIVYKKKHDIDIIQHYINGHKYMNLLNFINNRININLKTKMLIPFTIYNNNSQKIYDNILNILNIEKFIYEKTKRENYNDTVTIFSLDPVIMYWIKVRSNSLALYSVSQDVNHNVDFTNIEYNSLKSNIVRYIDNFEQIYISLNSLYYLKANTQLPESLELIKLSDDYSDLIIMALSINDKLISINDSHALILSAVKEKIIYKLVNLLNNGDVITFILNSGYELLDTENEFKNRFIINNNYCYIITINKHNEKFYSVYLTIINLNDINKVVYIFLFNSYNIVELFNMFIINDNYYIGLCFIVNSFIKRLFVSLLTHEVLNMQEKFNNNIAFCSDDGVCISIYTKNSKNYIDINNINEQLY